MKDVYQTPLKDAQCVFVSQPSNGACSFSLISSVSATLPLTGAPLMIHEVAEALGGGEPLPPEAFAAY